MLHPPFKDFFNVTFFLVENDTYSDPIPFYRTLDTTQRQRVLRHQHGARPQLCAAAAQAGLGGRQRQGEAQGHQQG